MATKQKNTTTSRDVDKYVARLPRPARTALSGLRKQIKALAPGASELISYQVPTFRYKDAPLVSYAAFPNHGSLFVISFAFMRAHKAALKSYHTSGVTIRYLYEKPLPASLVKKVITWRMKENERRAKQKAGTRYGAARSKAAKTRISTGRKTSPKK
jgi:uncharacterized protein YdhG (YjbR/CyaY superfamily)